ncbi:MAG: bifunctional (p)ppGpp synthetase/guanosine-3',5'-bis(diphosphate) 3'-pyrophosphohydrolase, partial [Bacteroidales bacterium]|nr:bifunctional (p)ppGpp synthetase/guanosine-3',5'-bis(diphosphate) 3'-pyrophosphohydrolase [Bacteroidales bacterium]
AFNFAVEAHKDMRRKTGEPYIYHPLEVARIAAAEIGLGETSIICALLHDVVEDTDHSLDEIKRLFGDKVSRIIDGLTKIGEIFDTTIPSIQAENFRKMFLTLSDDVRVILIKLADRLHNMRTLDAMPKEKQLKIASETIYLFSPLAHRLGLFAIKSELEDLALKYTEPEIYLSISDKIKDSEKKRKSFIVKFNSPIKKALNEQHFSFEIEGRLKSIYSIWKKMKQKEITFEEVFDLFAIRIIIDSNFETEKVDCWRVYSIVTDYYSPKQNRLRDWISTPKTNGYEALHSTVMGHDGKWVEVQIRTKRMDEIAERGYAAHWKYKNKSSAESALDHWLNRLTEMLKIPESDALDFLDDFKLHLFSDEIFVFTPKGDIRTLPVGSTALDFAYNIHTEIGNQCIGAKVNHKLVALSYKLKNGDQVEIITSKKQIPREDWLNFVITAKSKSRINEAVKTERREYAGKGKEMLIGLLNQIGVEFSKSNQIRLQKYYNIRGINELYYLVATGSFTMKELKSCFNESERWGILGLLTRPFSRSKPGEPKTLDETIAEKISKNPESLILESDISKIKHVISDCCNPIPGDDVFGFMVSKNQIKIHRTNCDIAIQLMSKYGNRIVKAKWKNKESIAFLAGIKITSIDEKGLVNDITKTITEKLNLNIRSFHLESHDGMSNGIVMLYVYDTKSLQDLIKHLKKLKPVKKVIRVDRMDEKIL